MVEKLSVVIPSLGGDLDSTLESLNSGSVAPDEIIICLPNSSHDVKNVSKYANATVIYAGKYSQVYQRICGFNKAKFFHVLQLDDDIILDHKCIELLLKELTESKKNVSVSPYLKNIEDGQPFCPGKKSGLMMTLYYWLINGPNGFVPGGISLAGTEFCVKITDLYSKSKTIDVEWQPGGCVLHKKENLVLEDYYPYDGKAYSEDLLHSYYLNKKGVTLQVVLDAVAYLNINPGISIFKELKSSFKTRLYFVRMANLSVLRMMIYFLVYVLKSAVNSALGFVKKRS